MLQPWQKKFPQSFKAYPQLLTQLTSQDQERLANLLTILERHELLNEDTLNKLLTWSTTYLSELSYLIEKLAAFHSLNQNTFHYLFMNATMPELQASMQILIERSLLTPELITLLFSTPNIYSSVQFITRALTAQVDAADIIAFLAQSQVMNGLNRTITLFDLSKLPYNKEYFKELHILTKLFTNPLCKTIFDARLRCFSDYSEPTEPIKLSDAVNLVMQLSKLNTQEQQIAVFFDFFAAMRPFPASQRDLVEVDVAQEVNNALISYCNGEIAAIDSQQDYLCVRKMLKKLQAQGGNKEIFDNIKYSIASTIEATDLCSTRNYQELMDEIWQALHKPQTNLESVLKELESTKGVLRTVSAQMRRQAFISNTSSPSSDESDIDPAVKRPAQTTN